MEKAAGIEPAEGMGVRNQLERELHKMKDPGDITVTRSCPPMT